MNAKQALSLSNMHPSLWMNFSYKVSPRVYFVVIFPASSSLVTFNGRGFASVVQFMDGYPYPIYKVYNGLERWLNN